MMVRSRERKIFPRSGESACVSTSSLKIQAKIEGIVTGSGEVPVAGKKRAHHLRKRGIDVQTKPPQREGKKVRTYHLVKREG